MAAAGGGGVMMYPSYNCFVGEVRSALSRYIIGVGCCGSGGDGVELNFGKHISPYSNYLCSNL